MLRTAYIESVRWKRLPKQSRGIRSPFFPLFSLGGWKSAWWCSVPAQRVSKTVFHWTVIEIIEFNSDNNVKNRLYPFTTWRSYWKRKSRIFYLHVSFSDYHLLINNWNFYICDSAIQFRYDVAKLLKLFFRLPSLSIFWKKIQSSMITIKTWKL